MLPSKLNILGIEYNIEYLDNPSEVDTQKRVALWGYMDPWIRTIRVYKRDRSFQDIFQTLMHEVIHAIAEQLSLNVLDEEDNHPVIDQLAVALSDFLFRNKLITFQ